MKNNIFGVFKAIVTDVDCFKDTGKIKTKISIFNNYYTTKDLLNDYNMETFKKNLESDKFTYIMMPFGGGNDYGMFKLPPINSVGLVTFIDGNPNLPLWMGGLANLYFSKNGELIESDFPSDNLESNNSMVSFSEEEDKSTLQTTDFDSFVIKTKTNKMTDFSNPQEMNWKNNLTENGLLMNKEKFSLFHTDTENSKQRIQLKNDEEFTISIEHEDEEVKSSIICGPKGFKTKLEGKNVSAEISQSNNITLSYSKENQNTKIVQNEKEIRIENNESLIVLKKMPSGKDEVIISAPVVRISSDNILLGNGDFRIVTSPSPLNFTLEDGSLLTTANNVRI